MFKLKATFHLGERDNSQHIPVVVFPDGIVYPTQQRDVYDIHAQLHTHIGNDKTKPITFRLNGQIPIKKTNAYLYQ